MTPLLELVYLYGKVLGAIGAGVGTLTGTYKYLRSAHNQRKSMNETVALLATSHLPHIQQSLDSHGEMLTKLSSTVELNSTRLEDTKKSVHLLGEAFVRHLENSAKTREV